MYSDSENGGDIERFKLHSVPELMDLPEADWLIKGVLTTGAMAGLYGPSGHGKSFISLAWALSIATGIDWFGHSTRQGAAIYVAAEGGRSIRKRVHAWMKTEELEALPDAFFLLDSVQVRDKDDLVLLAERIDARGIQPELLVLDTLARCFVGGEENSAKEMGEFVEGIAWLQQTTKAAVVVVHHTGKQAGEIERGSSALRAAADVMVSVLMDDAGIITVKNNKQKDAEEFKRVKLQLEVVPVPSAGDDQATSCILVRAGTAKQCVAEVLPRHLVPTLEALARCHKGIASSKRWMNETGLKERTLHTHREALVSLGYVAPVDLRRGSYALTEKGRLAVPEPAATAREPGQRLGKKAPLRTAATATTPLGVAVAAEGALGEGERQ